MSFVQLFNSQIKVSIKPGRNTSLNVQFVFLNLFIINIQREKNALLRAHTTCQLDTESDEKKAKSMNLNIRGKKMITLNGTMYKCINICDLIIKAKTNSGI